MTEIEINVRQAELAYAAYWDSTILEPKKFKEYFNKSESR